MLLLQYVGATLFAVFTHSQKLSLWFSHIRRNSLCGFHRFAEISLWFSHIRRNYLCSFHTFAETLCGF